MENKLVGNIASFHPDKGYGFIACPSRPNHLYFHVRDGIDQAVMSRIDTVGEGLAGWIQPHIPVTCRERVPTQPYGAKSTAFDIQLRQGPPTPLSQ